MHPPLEPYRQGTLERPDGNVLYWEASGNPAGIPALYLHGGPGSGLGHGSYRRKFDPGSYHIIGFDQRGCGRSTPWSIDALDRLDTNTTQAQIEDIEALRGHLGIEKWLIHGVSWGSTLALAYALEHPDRCSAVVLMAVTSGSRDEIDWITERMGWVFPEVWHEFARHAGTARPVEGYARLLRDPDPAVRTKAAELWDRWETMHISLGPHHGTEPLHPDLRLRENFATQVTHYWAQDCFLPGDLRIVDRVHQLAGIPGVLLHGRLDVSCPAEVPWRLADRWPGSTLYIEETEGHGGPLLAERTVEATDALRTVIGRPADLG